MQVEIGVQPNHSENITVVGRFNNPEDARRAYHEILESVLKDLASRAPFASGSLTFGSYDEFRQWVRHVYLKHRNERSRIKVRKTEGSSKIFADVDFGLTFSDWTPDDVAIGVSGDTLEIEVYTAGYGLDYLENVIHKYGGESYEAGGIAEPISDLLEEFRSYQKNNPKATPGDFLVMKKLEDADGY